MRFCLWTLLSLACGSAEKGDSGHESILRDHGAEAEAEAEAEHEGDGEGESDEGGVGELTLYPDVVTCNILELGRSYVVGFGIRNESEGFGVNITEVKIINAGVTTDGEGIETSAFLDIRAGETDHEPPFTLEGGETAEFVMNCQMFTAGETEGSVRIKTTDFSQNSRGEFTVALSATAYSEDTGS
jgi:hypothetical protein